MLQQSGKVLRGVLQSKRVARGNLPAGHQNQPRDTGRLARGRRRGAGQGRVQKVELHLIVGLITRGPLLRFVRHTIKKPPSGYPGISTPGSGCVGLTPGTTPYSPKRGKKSSAFRRRRYARARALAPPSGRWPAAWRLS